MDPDLTPNDDASILPKRTTPTWDMELLLSGATVFALFQIAQAMMEGGAYLLPRLQGDLLLLGGMLFTYGYGGIILLALTFALHLVIRAYWVALVGMNSVYPAGIKVDSLNAGPIAKEILARRWQSLDASIERADNTATIVFGIGVSIVLVLVPVSLTVTLMFGLAGLVAWLADLPGYTPMLLLGLMALMFVPYYVAVMLDTKRGGLLIPGTRAHRLCRVLLLAYSKVGMSRAANPLVTIFTSNIGERRGQGIVMVVMLVAMLSSIAGLSLSRKDLGVGAFGAFPDPQRGMSSSVEGRNYASTQEPGWSPAAPYLPDMVVRGDYARLVVPHMPTFNGHVFDGCRSSGEREKAGEERQRRDQMLECVNRAIQVRLDGQVVVLLPEWYTEPSRDLRGLLYMVPVRGLADGRHDISVLTAPRKAPADDEDPEQPFIIPFWR